MRSSLSAMLILTCPLAVLSDSGRSPLEASPPSVEMLEFLGELEAIDEETWQILEHHALKDLAQKKEVNSE